MVLQRSSASSMSAVWSYKRHLQLCCVAASSVFILGFLSTAGAKPTLTFSFPQSLQGFPTFTSFTQQIIENRSARQMKTYR